MRRLPFAGLGLAVLLALPAQAKEGDTFRPFVSYTRYYDDNLFRLDDGKDFTIVIEDDVPVVVTRETSSDHYGVLAAGIDVDWRPGRQRILASASKSQVRFSKYSSLDYDGSDYQLRWNWRLGNRWSGQVGATEKVTQTSFADFYLFEAINNTVTRADRFASAEWQFHPRWSVGVGAASLESTNSTCPKKLDDYKDDSVSATLGYATPRGSKLRAQFRKVDGEYSNRGADNECDIPITTLDRFYSQTEYNLLADWAVEGKLVVRGKLGYVQRENDELSDRDFSGPAGRISADYFPTGKTMLTWAIYRELANSDDINASYQVVSGTSLGAAWLVASKTTLRMNAQYENRSFEGDTGVVTTLAQRDEDTLSGTLSLSYVPVKMATIDLGVQTGRRDSNIRDGDYTFDSVFVSVRADF